MKRGKREVVSRESEGDIFIFLLRQHARSRVSAAFRAAQINVNMFTYPPICRLIDLDAPSAAALEALPSVPARKAWTPELAQQRLMAVINGECCFNCFKNLADYETHYCMRCKGRGQDVMYCSEECQSKHLNTHKQTCAMTRAKKPNDLRHVNIKEALGVD